MKLTQPSDSPDSFWTQTSSISRRQQNTPLFSPQKLFTDATHYQKSMAKDPYQDVTYVASFYTLFGYMLLFVFGHIRDFARKVQALFVRKETVIAPLLDDYEDFYTRRLYGRLQDCWGRTITSKPGASIDVVDRALPLSKTPMKTLGTTSHCVNLGSYNYLGYAEIDGGVNGVVYDTVNKYGVATCSPPIESGLSKPVVELQQTVARFLNKEDALVFGMGFATNSLILHSLVGPGCLLISDKLNHASIVVGARSSGAKIQTFEHNDPDSLERTLRKAIVDGQPKTHAPWDKILILVEGIYSMEGYMCCLKEIVEIKKKYGAYLWLDEAHSIGAMGGTGRGVCEQLGVDTQDVDIMMGTFTKSFGGVGGYVAATKDVIQTIRTTSAINLYAQAMSPVTAQHVAWVLGELMGTNKGASGAISGRRKIRNLRRNSIYFRQKLIEMGLVIYGDDGSPIIPIMIYSPGKIAAFSRECLARGLAVVVVGFPATPLILSRARICVSAAHTKADLDFALEVIDEVAGLLDMKYKKRVKTLTKKAFDDAFFEEEDLSKVENWSPKSIICQSQLDAKKLN